MRKIHVRLAAALFGLLTVSTGVIYTNSDHLANFCANSNVPIVRSMIRGKAEKVFIEQALHKLDDKVKGELNKQSFIKTIALKTTLSGNEMLALATNAIVSTIKDEFHHGNISFEFFKLEGRTFSDSLGLKIKWLDQGPIIVLKVHYSGKVEEIKKGMAFERFSAHLAGKVSEKLKAGMADKLGGLFKPVAEAISHVIEAIAREFFADINFRL